jgi:hypothetical protein
MTEASFVVHLKAQEEEEKVRKIVEKISFEKVQCNILA